jgi:hypothetical protein
MSTRPVHASADARARITPGSCEVCGDWLGVVDQLDGEALCSRCRRSVNYVDR